MLDPYSHIEQFEEKLSEWERARFLKERRLFRKMMNLILDPLKRSKETFPTLDEKDFSVTLIARLFNDFEAAIRLTLMGLGPQAYMPIRDCVETMLLLELFGVDHKLALRWMKDLKEYQAGNVIAILKNDHGIDLPLNELYNMFSQLAHVNFVSAVHVVEEVEAGEDQFLRTYHFGGYRNEGFMESLLVIILTLQVMALRVVLPGRYSGIDPEYELWWKDVCELPSTLREELGLDTIEVEEQPFDRMGRKIAVKLNITGFDARLANLRKFC